MKIQNQLVNTMIFNMLHMKTFTRNEKRFLINLNLLHCTDTPAKH